MKNAFFRFITKWFVSSLGLWIAAGFLTSQITYSNRLIDTLAAGFILAIVNTILKPILVVLSLPAIIFSLGLFMIILNGAMVYLVSKLYTPMHITNFWAAVFAGMVIGLVNFLVSTIIDTTKQ
jgi:putative membrane protein